MTVLGGVDGGGGGGGAGTRAQAKTLELLCDMAVETVNKLNEEVPCYPYIKDMDHHARWIGRFART